MTCFDDIPKFEAGETIPLGKHIDHENAKSFNIQCTNTGPTTFDFKKHNEVDYTKHYLSLGAKCSSCQTPIEHIDISRHFDFNLGNAIKYIWRAKFKENTKQDLEKAIWYLTDYIENHCQGDK